MSKADPPWWSEAAGFFGEFYMRGDNSKEGHLSAHSMSLSERTLHEVDGLIRLLDLGGTENILDVPCGYGRHSIELGRRGYPVTGVDINTAHLEVARREAKHQHSQAVFEHSDMQTLGYRNRFDLVINMFYSFGFFASDEQNTAVLRNLFNALKPSGRLLMHTDVNIGRIRNGKYKFHEVRTIDNGGLLTIDEQFDESARRIEGIWTIAEGDKIRSKHYSMRVYEAAEFVDLCIRIGFETCDIFGGWNAEKYDDESEEIIFIAKKSPSSSSSQSFRSL